MKNASNLLVILVFCILGEGFCILLYFVCCMLFFVVLLYLVSGVVSCHHYCILSMVLMFCHWCWGLLVLLYVVVCCCVVCSFFRLYIIYFRFSVYCSILYGFVSFAVLLLCIGRLYNIFSTFIRVM